MNRNLILAWLGVLLGFLSGLYLGLNFHRPDWLGGYDSFKRRLYRLAHISLFGLAVVNLMFHFTARSLGAASLGLAVASWAFIIGAIAMPICCVVAAHFPRNRPLFALPVLSLLLGAALTLLAVLETAKLPSRASTVPSPLNAERFPRRDPRIEPMNRSSRREEALTVFSQAKWSLLTPAATRLMGGRVREKGESIEGSTFE